MERFARWVSDLRLMKNRRVTTTDLPRRKERRPMDVRNKISQGGRDFLGSARLSRVGFDVAPKRTFLDALLFVGSAIERKSSRSRDALASTRDGRAPQIV